MGNQMVKEHMLTLMVESILGNGRMGMNIGQGTFTFSNGVKWVGEFSSTKHQYLKFTRYNPWNITEYDKKGRISEILLVRNIPTKSLISEDLFSRQKTSVLMI